MSDSDIVAGSRAAGVQAEVGSPRAGPSQRLQVFDEQAECDNDRKNRADRDDRDGRDRDEDGEEPGDRQGPPEATDHEGHMIRRPPAIATGVVSSVIVSAHHWHSTRVRRAPPAHANWPSAASHHVSDRVATNTTSWWPQWVQRVLSTFRWSRRNCQRATGWLGQSVIPGPGPTRGLTVRLPAARPRAVRTAVGVGRPGRRARDLARAAEGTRGHEGKEHAVARSAPAPFPGEITPAPVGGSRSARRSAVDPKGSAATGRLLEPAEADHTMSTGPIRRQARGDARVDRALELHLARDKPLGRKHQLRVRHRSPPAGDLVPVAPRVKSGGSRGISSQSRRPAGQVEVPTPTATDQLTVSVPTSWGTSSRDGADARAMQHGSGYSSPSATMAAIAPASSRLRSS
jgi:hypothetical protein